jgi:hypothetical protein
VEKTKSLASSGVQTPNCLGYESTPNDRMNNEYETGEHVSGYSHVLYWETPENKLVVTAMASKRDIPNAGRSASGGHYNRFCECVI